MTNKYNHTKIEDSWRDKWFEDNIYEAVDFSEKPKKYILAELPYPSGEFLHCGHMMRYTVPEIYSRFLRMQGYNVMFPMGWDCFGLPAETFAIKKGITPQEAIKIAIFNFKKSLQTMGYAFDWDREISTSDPEFYKWTQWMFIRLWKAGLAELKEMPVWWCNELGVLADEEVLPDGNGGKISERGSYPVKRKMFKQWVLKITDYADRLLDGLDQTEYLESVKQGQINWIGKKEGNNVHWETEAGTLVTFTTRVDTIFGVTFLAIAPEHPIVKDLIEKSSNKKEVKAYVENVKNLSDIERMTKEKTGVLIQGVSAKHPLSEVTKEIPVFVADYILLDYGTGVVQGVPAHDERDFEFANKYNLEILKVIETPKDNNEKVYTGYGKVINSGKYENMDSLEFMETITQRLEKEGTGSKAKTYKLRDQIFSRQRYWGEPIPLVNDAKGNLDAVADESLPVELPIMNDFLPSEDGTSPLERNSDWNSFKDSSEKEFHRETDTMPTWAGSNWYYIRYIDPKNSQAFADFEKMKYWLPVDKYFGDAGHTTAHLMYTRFWYKALFDQNLMPYEEPIKWRMSGGMLLGPDGKKMSKSKGNTVDPKEVVKNYGADATRTYLAFIGPYEDTYPWNYNGIMAIYRLLRTIYEAKAKVKDNVNNPELVKNYNKLVKNTTSMLENLKMNTAVSEIMIFNNHLKEVQDIPSDVWNGFIRVIAPFAPFLAEDLWQELNGFKTWNKNNSVHLAKWPSFDEELAKDTELEIPIQFNGKVRDKLLVEIGKTEAEIKELVLNRDTVKNTIGNKEIKRFIYIKDKIVNLVF